ncbi:hypothetical protein RFI_13166, partial [Reticulomyxa filosa]
FLKTRNSNPFGSNLRKTIDVCTTTLVEESTNNYVPDVIVREIVSFIGNQNIRFVDMNAMKYMRHSPRHDEDAWWSVEMLVSQWKSGPTESHSHHPHPHSHSHRDKRSERRSDSKKQNMGQSILRNEKNLTKMYSHKKSNRRKLLLHNAEDFFSIKKKYKEAYGNNNESAHLFPTWKKLNRNGEHDSLWYDCSQLVQINGICVFGSVENSKFISVRVANDIDTHESEHCRLLVQHLDGWACFTDLNIICRYIELTFDGTNATIHQLIFI